MLELISGLGFHEHIEDAAAEIPELIDGLFRAIAEQILKLGKRQFDGIQVWREGGR